MHSRKQKGVIITVLLLLLASMYSGVLYYESKHGGIGGIITQDPTIPTLSAPSFSHTGGYYTEPFTLSISTDLADAQIYYTLDGSTPKANSLVYEGPITIKSRVGEPNMLTNIPLNDRTDYLQWRPPLEEVFKATVVRAFATDGKQVSPVVTHTYFVDEEMDVKYPAAVISIAIEHDYLFNNKIGLFVNNNFLERGIEWERPAHFEFYEPDGTLAFAQQVGIRVHGGVTREAPTKSLRVYAREEYGKKAINYQLFPDKDIDVFERFIIRYRGTNFKDEFQAHLVKGATDLDVQYYRPAVMFINGEFWGIYAIRDRFDDNYLKTHYDVRDADVLTDLGTPSYGDSTHYDMMIDYIKANESRINEPQVFAQIEEYMDVENFRDFTIVQNFIMNIDQPGKNVDFWRSRTVDPDNEKHDGRWRWMLYDLDMGFGDYYGLWMNGFVYNTSLEQHGADDVLSGPEMAELIPELPSFAPAVDKTGPERTFLLRALLKNDAYRIDYINRYSDLLNTAFKPERMLDVLADMEAEYAPFVEEDALRTGVEDDGLFARRVRVLEQFAEERPDLVRQHALDYFPELTGTAELTIEANSDRGTVIVNSIEINEHTIGVDDPADPYPWEGVYFQGIPLRITAVPKPGYRFVGWEVDGDVVVDGTMVGGDISGVDGGGGGGALNNEVLELVLQDDDVTLKAVFR